MAHVVNLTALVVQRAVQAEPLIGACCRHHSTGAFQRPYPGQSRVQVNFTFVEVEKLEAGVLFDCAFFKNARRAFFSL